MLLMTVMVGVWVVPLSVVLGVKGVSKGLLKKSIRRLAAKIVRRISSLWPQLLHILAIGQHCFSTFDDVEDPFLSQRSVEPTFSTSPSRRP